MFAVLYFINFDGIKTYLKALLMIIGLVLCVVGVAMIPATIITAVVLFLAKLVVGAVIIFFFSLLTKPR